MQTESMSNQEVIGSFPTYVEAERAVNELADRDFPVDRVMIVGAGMKYVEQITGRRDYAKVAGNAALAGAGVGAIIGWLFGLANWVDPLISAVFLAMWGIVIGAAIGAGIGMVSHAMANGRRDFSSTSAMRADRYELFGEPSIAGEARRMLYEASQTPPGTSR